MVDVPKQIEYWRKSSEEDPAAAESLLKEGHLRHCLFFAHLAVEKMLKAHVTKQTKDMPPQMHNLVRLAEIAGLPLSSEQANFLGSFDMYQLEGRYPDSTQVPVDSETARQKVALAGDILRWLKAQL